MKFQARTFIKAATFHGLLGNALFRLMAESAPPPPPPPLENFADIPYLEENFKLRRIRDVCTVCAGALVSDSLLHMLSYQIEKMKTKGISEPIVYGYLVYKFKQIVENLILVINSKRL